MSQPSELDAPGLLPSTVAPTTSSTMANVLRRIRSTSDIPPPRHSLTIAPDTRLSNPHDSADVNLPNAPASARNGTFDSIGSSTLASPARTYRSVPSRRSRSPGPTVNTRMGLRRSSTPRPTPTTPTTTPAAVATNQPQSWIRKAMLFFGVGRGASRERRTIVALFFALCSSCVQIIVITVLLALSGTILKSPSPNKHGLTEWVACERPLGVWACIWVFRSILASSLNYWSFLRERKIRQQRQAEESTNNLTSPTLGSPPTSPLASPSRRRSATNRARQAENESIARYSRNLPYTRLYSRLTLLSSLLTLSWFLTAHILEYTSIDTCRHDSPHIWWLTFGILCLMYLSVLEVMVLSVVVFIVAPILFLFWNIVLVCMGRHPLQTAGQIRHEIGKLPKSVVDRIPLVIYIPPPPEELAELAGLKSPESAYTYPPKPYSPKISGPARRFKFLRKFSSFRGNSQPNDKLNTKKGAGTKDVEKGLNSGEPQTWEEHWEKGEYPFVVLEGNRAACAICLMDFEEPKKLFETGNAAASSSAPTVVEGPSTGKEQEDGEKKTNGEATNADDSAIDIVPLTPAAASAPLLSNTGATELMLEDAGEGAQPLRLLECGHVFHKTCLDPWLTDVSGRCPTCQRAVVLAEPKNKKTRPNRTERRPT